MTVDDIDELDQIGSSGDKDVYAATLEDGKMVFFTVPQQVNDDGDVINGNLTPRELLDADGVLQFDSKADATANADESIMGGDDEESFGDVDTEKMDRRAYGEEDPDDDEGLVYTHSDDDEFDDPYSDDTISRYEQEEEDLYANLPNEETDDERETQALTALLRDDERRAKARAEEDAKEIECYNCGQKFPRGDLYRIKFEDGDEYPVCKDCIDELEGAYGTEDGPLGDDDQPIDFDIEGKW